MKKIAIVTSGGDCAGLNATLRAVVLHAASKGAEVIGIENGSHGLLCSPPKTRPLTVTEADSFLLRQGGTILGTTNKGNPFAYTEEDGTVHNRAAELIEAYNSLGADGLIVIGGDGSLAIFSKLAQQGGIPLICVPKTIDNDLGLTEMSVGFDTAVQVATEALDRLQPTAASHDRIMILEVMGREAGHIALTAGIAGGADVILIPEIRHSLTLVADHINALRMRGRNFALVVVSEAVLTEDGKNVTQTYFGEQNRFGGIGAYIGEKIADLCKAETRVTVLGHVQRGGQPSAQDRLLAAAFGVHAVELIEQGRFGRMVAWSHREVTDVAIEDAMKAYQQVDPEGTLVKTARGLGICLGDIPASFP